jgi:hypothetical protein
VSNWLEMILTSSQLQDNMMLQHWPAMLKAAQL